MSVTTKPQRLNDYFVARSGMFSMNEAAPEEGEASYDKRAFCARLRGPMAVIDGESSNGRYYPRAVWEKAIKTHYPEGGRGQTGVCGHDQAIDDFALGDGKITHKITKLWINEDTKTVDGEILIINSRSGRDLYAYLLSDVGVAVSSRAFGNFKGKTPTGADIVDEEDFYLQGFDFVLNPGVEVARPKIVESVQPKEERKKMELNEAKIMETLQLNAKLQLELNESLKKVNETERALNESRAESETLRKSLNEAQASLKWVVKNVGKRPAQAIKEIHEGINKWLSIPEFNEYAKEIGLFDTLGTTLPETTKKLMESVEQYGRLGSPTQIKDKLVILESYNRCGSTPEVIDKSLDLLESYSRLGKTPDELKQVLRRAAKAIKTHNQARSVITAYRLVESLKIEESSEARMERVKKTAELINQFGAKAVKDKIASFNKISESKPAQQKPGTTPVTTSPTPVPTRKKLDESDNGTSSAMKLVKMMEYKPVETSAQMIR